jgi:hypothetical protein
VARRTQQLRDDSRPGHASCSWVNRASGPTLGTGSICSFIVSRPPKRSSAIAFIVLCVAWIIVCDIGSVRLVFYLNKLNRHSYGAGHIKSFHAGIHFADDDDAGVGISWPSWR